MSFSSKTQCCCSATLLYLNTSRASDKFCANVSCFSSISCSSCWCILNRITVFSKEQFLYSIHFNYLHTQESNFYWKIIFWIRGQQRSLEAMMRSSIATRGYLRPPETIWGHYRSFELIKCILRTIGNECYKLEAIRGHLRPSKSLQVIKGQHGNKRLLKVIRGYCRSFEVIWGQHKLLEVIRDHQRSLYFIAWSL